MVYGIRSQLRQGKDALPACQSTKNLKIENAASSGEGRAITFSPLEGEFHTPEHDMQLQMGIRKLKTRGAGVTEEVGADWQVPLRGRGRQLIERGEIHGLTPIS